MQRREFMAILGGAAATWPRDLLAQPAGKIPRVGWIILGSPTGGLSDIFSYYDSFRAGLADLNYVEGHNIVLIAIASSLSQTIIIVRRSDCSSASL